MTNIYVPIVPVVDPMQATADTLPTSCTELVTQNSAENTDDNTSDNEAEGNTATSQENTYSEHDTGAKSASDPPPRL